MVVGGGGGEEVVVVEDEDVGRTGGMMAVVSLLVGAGRVVVGDVPSLMPIYVKVSMVLCYGMVDNQETGKWIERELTPNTSTHKPR